MLPDFSGKYVEPFAGSACLFWALQPEAAVLGDVNEELIHCYRALASDPEKISSVLEGLENSSCRYYNVREAYHSEKDCIKRAAYFIYLNRYCFNGLYRTDKRGRFNVPYGGYRTGRLPELDHLLKYSLALKRVEVVSTDFEATIADHVVAGDLVYLDPPFYTQSSRVFREYGPHPFVKEDLARFAECLKLIDERGASFIASYLDTPEIRPIAENWQTTEFSALRRMSGFAIGRRRVDEVVFSNYEDLHVLQ